MQKLIEKPCLAKMAAASYSGKEYLSKLRYDQPDGANKSICYGEGLVLL
ncbi:hypothetical protein [Proteiniphilum sp. X52]|nr:hypothetical protein [Proteiniphilum sp. X52]